MDVNGSDESRLAALTSEIVAAYAKRNPVDRSALTALIARVSESLERCRQQRAHADAKGPRYSLNGLKPAVPVAQSIKGDYLVCLEDGIRRKMLKRHLRTVYNMSPEEYRRKWGLPDEYPMVAPNYAKVRSKVARNMGLGKTNRK